jgi:hypothetical protein
MTILRPTVWLAAGLFVTLLAPAVNAKPPILNKLNRAAREMSKINGRYGAWRVTRGHAKVVVQKSGIFFSDKSLQNAIRQPTPDGHGGRIGERVAGKVEISYAKTVPRTGLAKLVGKLTGRTTKTQWKTIGPTQLVERAVAGKPTVVRGLLKVDKYQMPDNDQLGHYKRSQHEVAPAKTISSASQLLRWWGANSATLTGSSVK